jgi:hypothetical protein
MRVIRVFLGAVLGGGFCLFFFVCIPLCFFFRVFGGEDDAVALAAKVTVLNPLAWVVAVAATFAVTWRQPAWGAKPRDKSDNPEGGKS